MSALHWAVTVALDGEEIVTLASNHMAGRQLSADDERAIRLAAHALLGFVGREAAALLAGEGLTPTCTWTQDDWGGSSRWETTCGQAFEFNEDGPVANGFGYCGYCGKSLVEARTSELAPPPEQEPTP